MNKEKTLENNYHMLEVFTLKIHKDFFQCFIANPIIHKSVPYQYQLDVAYYLANILNQYLNYVIYYKDKLEDIYPEQQKVGQFYNLEKQYFQMNVSQFQTKYQNQGSFYLKFKVPSLLDIDKYLNQAFMIISYFNQILNNYEDEKKQISIYDDVMDWIKYFNQKSK